MPGIQWLGTVQRKPRSWDYISSAIREGTAAYEAAKERGLKERELDIRERGLKPYEDLMAIEEEKIQKDFDATLAKLTYQQKKDAADLIMQSLKMMDEDAAQKLLSDPRVEALFKDLGMPVPYGAYRVGEEGVFTPLGKGLSSIAEAISGWFGGKRTTPTTDRDPLGIRRR